MKLNCKNSITVVGEVKNYKLKETKSGKKCAYIGIKNTETNNYIQVTLYDRANLQYNKQDVTVSSLAKVFLDQDDKPKGVYVTAKGSASDFVTENGVYESNNVFGLYPASDEAQQKATFVLEGIVESIARPEDVDGNEYMKIKVGTLSTRGKEETLEITGVNEKTVYVREEELVETLEDLSSGDFVSLKGYINNIMPKYDEFGDVIEKGFKEFTCKKVAILCEADEIDSKDVANYKKAKTLKQGESIKVNSKNDDEDELD